MEKLFFWMSIPDQAIPETAWNEFLNGMATVMFIAVAITTILTVILYGWSARRKKVFFPGDVFKAYLPMWWLCLSLVAGVVSTFVCIWQYSPALNTAAGELGIALQIGIVSVFMTALPAYLLIAFIPGITPAKFCYRPVPYRHKKNSAA